MNNRIEIINIANNNQHYNYIKILNMLKKYNL